MPIILIFIGIFFAQMEYFVTYSLSLIFGQILDFLFLFLFWKKILHIFTLVLGCHLMQDPSQDAHN